MLFIQCYIRPQTNFSMTIWKLHIALWSQNIDLINIKRYDNIYIGGGIHTSENTNTWLYLLVTVKNKLLLKQLKLWHSDRKSLSYETEQLFKFLHHQQHEQHHLIQNLPYTSHWTLYWNIKMITLAS